MGGNIIHCLLNLLLHFTGDCNTKRVPTRCINVGKFLSLWTENKYIARRRIVRYTVTADQTTSSHDEDKYWVCSRNVANHITSDYIVSQTIILYYLINNLFLQQVYPLNHICWYVCLLLCVDLKPLIAKNRYRANLQAKKKNSNRTMFTKGHNILIFPWW